MVLLNAGRLNDYVREKIGFTLVLHDNLREAEIQRIEKSLLNEPFVKEVVYVDRETAANVLRDELGEDFTGFLGYNPLFESLEVKLNSSYTHPDSLTILEKNLLQLPQIKEIYYQRSLVSVINENVRKISIFLLIFSGLMLFVFSVLINNTIRIAIYSQRFLIHNMLLVGATRSFVRRPFVRKSILLGIYGAFFAGLLLGALMLTYKKELSGIINFDDLMVLGLVFAVILFSAVLLTWISTYLAVNRFLRMKFDELFY
jgi:cell division transport system permease protein